MQLNKYERLGVDHRWVDATSCANINRMVEVVLTTWLMLDTLDWRIVTASPMDGFLWAIAEALNPLWAMFTRVAFELYLETSLDNIFC